MNIKHRLIIYLSSLLILFQIAYGQNKGAKNPVEAVKLKKLIAAVEANPDNIKAHEDYIDVMDIRDPLLAYQYSIWLKRFPKSAIVPFAIGKAYASYNDARCKENLLKALSLNPGLADAWGLLSFNSSLIGDKPTAIEYMQQATKLDPQNADYAFYYASLHGDEDPVKYDSLMLNVTYHFPESKRGAEALCYLASLPFNANEKTAYYEMLYEMFLKQQPDWFSTGMREYYDYLLNTSPDKAFDLALRMVLNVKVNRQDWKQRIIVARDFVEARKLLDSNKPAEVEEILKHVDLKNKMMGNNIDAEEILAVFKAEATNADNKTKDAYDSLSMYYSKQPSDRVHKILLDYAMKLGMDSNKVDTDVWKIRNDRAWKETDFKLENYADHKQVSLSDYRGKVVLLTYWFPSCGPCREEFPHFESVLKEINNKDVAYLAINSFGIEEEYEMQIIKSSGYTFVPLRDDPNKAKGNLPMVQSAPTNFLIDQKGRVIFSNFQITGENERTLELMIRELLKMGNSKTL